MIRNRVMAAVALAAVGGLGLALPAAANDKGMTWAKAGHDARLGIDAVACAAGDGCDAYAGDTACTAALPVLCLKQDGSTRPNYMVHPAGGVMPDAFYRGWASGHIATTAPVVGNLLTSAAQADGLCEAAFGAGWRMAEHHDGRWIQGMGTDRYYGNVGLWHSDSPWSSSQSDGGGWAFWAYGNVRDDTRFWVRIIGQPANCWN
jgi:hypothetical protein